MYICSNLRGSVRRDCWNFVIWAFWTVWCTWIFSPFGVFVNIYNKMCEVGYVS